MSKQTSLPITLEHALRPLLGWGMVYTGLEHCFSFSKSWNVQRNMGWAWTSGLQPTSLPWRRCTAPTSWLASHLHDCFRIGNSSKRRRICWVLGSCCSSLWFELKSCAELKNVWKTVNKFCHFVTPVSTFLPLLPIRFWNTGARQSDVVLDGLAMISSRWHRCSCHEKCLVYTPRRATWRSVTLLIMQLPKTRTA